MSSNWSLRKGKMGMIDRMEREKRNKERRKHTKGEGVEVD